jgi:hypothetical protein
VTNEQLEIAVEVYREILNGVEPERLLGGLLAKQFIGRPLSIHKQYAHLWWMTDQIMLMKEEKPEEAMCWLGFVQGAIWAMGLLSTNELRAYSRGGGSDV